MPNPGYNPSGKSSEELQGLDTDARLPGAPFFKQSLTLTSAWLSNYIHYKVCGVLLILSQTSTGQPLKFGNE